MEDKVEISLRDAYIGEKRKQLREGSNIKKCVSFAAENV